jgi:hypothetical protein
MRSISLAATLLLGLPALAAGQPAPPSCAIKLDSTYQLVAPAGWRFVECSSAVRDQIPSFWLEPSLPPSDAPPKPYRPALKMYGGSAGRGTVEAALAIDREFYSTEFTPKDGAGLRTGDRRDVRVLHLTRRGEPFTWLTHAYLRVGPVVFWMAFVCEQEELCGPNYAAFRSLVGAMRVIRPNEFDTR